ARALDLFLEFLLKPLLIFHNRLFIVRGCLSFFKGNGSGGTGRQTISQTVAVSFPEKFCLSLYHTDSALMAGVGAKTAAVTFFFVYVNDPSLHVVFSSLHTVQAALVYISLDFTALL